MSMIELPGANPPPAPKPIGTIELVVYDDGTFNLKLNMPHAAMGVEYLMRAAVYTIDKAKTDAQRMVQAAPASLLNNGRLAN